MEGGILVISRQIVLMSLALSNARVFEVTTAMERFVTVSTYVISTWYHSTWYTTVDTSSRLCQMFVKGTCVFDTLYTSFISLVAKSFKIG